MTVFPFPRMGKTVAAGPATDPYIANVVLLCGFNGADGATTFVDESPSAKTITRVGNAQLDTADKKFGTASLLLDGTGDYCTLADHADWHFGNAAFTVECWAKAAAYAGGRLFSQWGSAPNQGWTLRQVTTSGTKLQWDVSTTGSDSLNDMVSSTTLTTGTWDHYCVDFNGAKYRMYINGVMRASFSTVRTLFNAGAVLALGAFSVTGTQGWNGWIDEARITKGVARYASDSGFTVPTEAFPRS